MKTRIEKTKKSTRKLVAMRFGQDLLGRVSTVADSMGVSQRAVVEMCVRHHLPRIEKRVDEDRVTTLPCLVLDSPAVGDENIVPVYATGSVREEQLPFRQAA